MPLRKRSGGAGGGGGGDAGGGTGLNQFWANEADDILVAGGTPNRKDLALGGILSAITNAANDWNVPFEAHALAEVRRQGSATAAARIEVLRPNYIFTPEVRAPHNTIITTTLQAAAVVGSHHIRVVSATGVLVGDRATFGGESHHISSIDPGTGYVELYLDGAHTSATTTLTEDLDAVFIRFEIATARADEVRVGDRVYIDGSFAGLVGAIDARLPEVVNRTVTLTKVTETTEIYTAGAVVSFFREEGIAPLAAHDAGIDVRIDRPQRVTLLSGTTQTVISSGVETLAYVDVPGANAGNSLRISLGPQHARGTAANAWSLVIELGTTTGVSVSGTTVTVTLSSYSYEATGARKPSLNQIIGTINYGALINRNVHLVTAITGNGQDKAADGWNTTRQFSGATTGDRLSRTVSIRKTHLPEVGDYITFIDETNSPAHLVVAVVNEDVAGTAYDNTGIDFYPVAASNVSAGSRFTISRISHEQLVDSGTTESAIVGNVEPVAAKATIPGGGANSMTIALAAEGDDGNSKTIAIQGDQDSASLGVSGDAYTINLTQAAPTIADLDMALSPATAPTATLGSRTRQYGGSIHQAYFVIVLTDGSSGYSIGFNQVSTSDPAVRTITLVGQVITINFDFADDQLFINDAMLAQLRALSVVASATQHAAPGDTTPNIRTVDPYVAPDTGSYSGSSANIPFASGGGIDSGPRASIQVPSTSANPVTFTAVAGGAAGNNIIIDIGNIDSGSLTVTVNGTTITLRGQFTDGVRYEDLKRIFDAVPAAVALVTLTYPAGRDANSVPHTNLFGSHTLTGGSDTNIFAARVISGVGTAAIQGVGLAEITAVTGVAASVAIGADITVTARNDGVASNGITITFVEDSSLTAGTINVAVSGNAITLTVQSLTTTNNAVTNAINNDTDANALVSAVSAGGTGTNSITLTATTHTLAGGVDAVGQRNAVTATVRQFSGGVTEVIGSTTVDIPETQSIRVARILSGLALPARNAVYAGERFEVRAIAAGAAGNSIIFVMAHNETPDSAVWSVDGTTITLSTYLPVSDIANDDSLNAATEATIHAALQANAAASALITFRRINAAATTLLRADAGTYPLAHGRDAVAGSVRGASLVIGNPNSGGRSNDGYVTIELSASLGLAGNAYSIRFAQRTQDRVRLDGNVIEIASDLGEDVLQWTSFFQNQIEALAPVDSATFVAHGASGTQYLRRPDGTDYNPGDTLQFTGGTAGNATDGDVLVLTPDTPPDRHYHITGTTITTGAAGYASGDYPGFNEDADTGSIRFRAASAGTVGNGIVITFFTSANLVIYAQGRNIIVNATTANTKDEIIAAVNAHAGASALVAAASNGANPANRPFGMSNGGLRLSGGTDQGVTRVTFEPAAEIDYAQGEGFQVVRLVDHPIYDGVTPSFYTDEVLASKDFDIDDADTLSVETGAVTNNLEDIHARVKLRDTSAASAVVEDLRAYLRPAFAGSEGQAEGDLWATSSVLTVASRTNAYANTWTLASTSPTGVTTATRFINLDREPPGDGVNGVWVASYVDNVRKGKVFIPWALVGDSAVAGGHRSNYLIPVDDNEHVVLQVSNLDAEEGWSLGLRGGGVVLPANTTIRVYAAIVQGAAGARGLKGTTTIVQQRVGGVGDVAFGSDSGEVASWAEGDSTALIPANKVPDQSAAEILSLIGTTAAHLNDMVVAVNLSGSTLTLTQADGSTLTVNLPSGGGGNGTSDGVVTGATLANNTLTLTRSESLANITVDLSSLSVGGQGFVPTDGTITGQGAFGTSVLSTVTRTTQTTTAVRLESFGSYSFSAGDVAVFATDPPQVRTITGTRTALGDPFIDVDTQVVNVPDRTPVTVYRGYSALGVAAEGVRDVVAAMLTAGSNITLTEDDANDTLTIAASGGGGNGSQRSFGSASGEIAAWAEGDDTDRLPASKMPASALLAPAWASGTHAVGVVVRHDNRLFICRTARTSSNTDNPATDTASWDEIAAIPDNSIADAKLGAVQPQVYIARDLPATVLAALAERWTSSGMWWLNAGQTVALPTTITRVRNLTGAAITRGGITLIAGNSDVGDQISTADLAAIRFLQGDVLRIQGATIIALIGYIPTGSESTRLVPSGGTSGQVLKKDSATDYDVSWADDTGGGGSQRAFGTGSGEIAAWAEGNSTADIPIGRIPDGIARDTEVPSVTGLLDAEGVRDTVAAFIQGTGGEVTVTHNDAANTLTLSLPSGIARDSEIPSNSDIDARIATWARSNSPSGTIPVGSIPASIARDSELPTANPSASATDTLAKLTVGSTTYEVATIGRGSGAPGSTETATLYIDNDTNNIYVRQASGSYVREGVTPITAFTYDVTTLANSGTAVLGNTATAITGNANRYEFEITTTAAAPRVVFEIPTGKTVANIYDRGLSIDAPNDTNYERIGTTQRWRFSRDANAGLNRVAVVLQDA